MSKYAKFEVHESSDGQWYFLVKSRNGKIVATGELYTTARGALRGLHALCEVMTDYHLSAVKVVHRERD